MPGSTLEIVLRERLACGPATEVWRVSQADKPGRVLVAKRWIDRPDVGAAADRLHRVAVTLEALAHPGVMPILGVGTIGDDLWTWTPLASGGSLRDGLAGGSQPGGPAGASQPDGLDQRSPAQHTSPDVARLGSTLADALAALHRVGIVHGSVHAGNVLLDAHGIPRLGDVAGPLRNTPYVDAREDVRALARLLDALLRRTDPMELTVEAQPDAPLPGLHSSAPLRRAIARAVQLEPTGRVPTASDFAAMLEDVRCRLQAHSRPASSDHGATPQQRSAQTAGQRQQRSCGKAPQVAIEAAAGGPPYRRASTAGPGSCSCLRLPCVE